MIHLGSPYIKEEISAALAAEHTALHTFFADIPDNQFYVAPPEVWTPADNLVHLIKSCSPVITALKLPRLALRMRFGTADHSSRSLAEIRGAYMEFAAAGTLSAPANFQPLVAEHTPVEKERILTKWQHKGAEFVKIIEQWSEDDLDHYILPHPLLGNLTIREMLLFTIYHNMHHVNDVCALLNQARVEWFETAKAV